jgi:hypothetical protein
MLPHFYHHQYRCRPSDEVIAEAATMQEKALIFWDDNIIGNLDYARELFRGLIPLRKRWTSQATFNIVDHEDLIQLAAASGCEALFIGLESISGASLRETGKGFNKPRCYWPKRWKSKRMAPMNDRFQRAPKFLGDYPVGFLPHQLLLPLAPRSDHKKQVLDPECFPRRPNCVEGTAQPFGRFLV